jgi:drug/metabolite transporter (DMT)-like permease
MLSSSIIATQACSLSFVSLFGYLIVFYAFLADTFVFHVSFSMMQLLGAMTILGATVTVGVLKFCRETQKSDDTSFSKINT